MNKRFLKVMSMLEEDFPKKDKVIKCLSEFSGLEIDSLSLARRHRLAKKMAAINEILKQYSIKTFDDYALISTHHLDKLLKNIKQISLIFYR
jgi:hypothetical protein